MKKNKLVIEVSKEGKILLHKSFFEQKKKPYTNVGIQLYSILSEDGDLPHLQGCSSIVHAGKAHGRSLSALDNTLRSVDIFFENQK